MNQEYPATINIIILELWAINRLLSARHALTKACGRSSSCSLTFTNLVKFTYAIPPFFRLASNAFPDFRSLGLIEKKKKKPKRVTKKSRNRRPGISASLLWSPETTRHETKINMADKLVDVIVKFRQLGKKDQPPKFYVVTMLSFQIKRSI